jgi:hypothetical protein
LWKKMKIFGKNIDLSEKNPKKIEILEKKKWKKKKFESKHHTLKITNVPLPF